MADSEKLTALKKAYADVILNTVKDAAARILASEMKAQRYQRELFAAKDEALRMLLRLKQMLDSKVSEAGTASLKQQTRIDELEAQLGEAEDIVKDLRSELRELQDELERVTARKMQPLCEETPRLDNAIGMAVSEDNTISTPVSVVCSIPAAEADPVATIEMRNPTSYNQHQHVYYGEDGSHKDSCFVCDPDFASIMMRSKETETYKNGCTHRIRALEGNVLGGSILSSWQRYGGEPRMFSRDNKEDKYTCQELASKVDVAHGVEKNKDAIKMMKKESEFVQCYGLRPCKQRYIERESFIGRNHDDSLDKNVGEDPVRIEGEDPEFEVAEKASPKSNEMSTQSGLGKAPDGIVDFDKACSVQNTRSYGKTSADEEVVKSAEVSQFGASVSDIESASVLLENLENKESEATEPILAQPRSSKFIKYTFSRKRKRGSLSSPDENSSDDFLKRRMCEKKDDSQELATESLLETVPGCLRELMCLPVTKVE
ncbi:hypothetical protein LINPERHAP2_LOCUS34424 [Linum perenne]